MLDERVKLDAKLRYPVFVLNSQDCSGGSDGSSQFLQSTGLLKDDIIQLQPHTLNIMVAPSMTEGISTMAGLASNQHEKYKTEATLLALSHLTTKPRCCLQFIPVSLLFIKYCLCCTRPIPRPLALQYFVHQNYFLAHIKCKVAVMQFKADCFAVSKNQVFLPPIGMDLSLAVPLSGLEYVHEQLGGGHQQATPPELTPTRLRSRIRATSWDAGVVKEASIRWAHQLPNQQPSRHSPAPSGATASSSFLDDGPMSNDTSSLPMPPLHSCHSSPYLGEPILQLPSHPASDHDTALLTLSALNEWHLSPSGDVHSGIDQPATKAAIPQLDLSYYPDGGPSHLHFPEESIFDHNVDSQKPSMMGRRSFETNILLEEAHKHVSQELWEKMEKEVACLTEDELNNTKGKEKGKELCRQDMQGTPSTRLQRQCYEKFKDTFPDAYQDILDMFDEAAVLGTATQTVSQCVNQDASLGHIHMTPGAQGVSNTASLSAVKESFNDVDDINYGVESLLRDDTFGKLTSDKNFPWKLMPNTLANDWLRITSYPAHKCLLPGEFHSNTSKSKAIGGLMQREISALVDALKAGTMVVIKVQAKFQATIIASEAPVIVGEAPPSDYLHPGAHCMFTDGHTDFNGPPWAKPTTAATKVKKARKGHNARPPSQQDDPHNEVKSLPQMTSPPPSCPFVFAKPPPHPAPPPSHPFVMATKTVMLDIISISTSNSKEELLEIPDNSKGKKRKLRFAAAPQMSKKHAPSAEAAKDKKGGMKGRPLSPLTVGSSSDEPLAPAGIQPAKRLWEGPIYPIVNLYLEVDSEGASNTNKKDPAIELAANAPALPVMVAAMEGMVDQLWNPPYNQKEASGLAPLEICDDYRSYVSGFAPWNDVDDLEPLEHTTSLLFITKQAFQAMLACAQ
ncbi:hypothetical protein BDR05DRAFT_949145 [Suillus weaverae]|nr:hypothetical protein BDR05DRAFT_949145 [Suillus weaverae]